MEEMIGVSDVDVRLVMKRDSIGLIFVETLKHCSTTWDSLLLQTVMWRLEGTVLIIIIVVFLCSPLAFSIILCYSSG